MSAETTKETGTTAPITPQKPEGGFLRSLRRFFGVLSDSQPIQPLTSRIVQPPPGLEDFTAKFQQGIEEHLIGQRQQELERINAIVASHSDAVAAEEIRRSSLEQQRVIAMQETRQVLDKFRVEEKLRHINSSKWGNRGEISIVDYDNWVRRDHPDIQGGLDLSYFYPDRGVEVERKQRIHNMGESTRYRWVPKRTPSSLRVLAIIDQRTGDRWIEVRSSRPYKNVPYREIGQNPVQESQMTFDLRWGTIARIPVEGIDSEVLFNDALAKEAIIRTTDDGLPDQLERAGQEWSRRQDWSWGSWVDPLPLFSGH